MEQIKWIWGRLKGNRLRTLIGIFFGLAYIASISVGPSVSSKIIDKVFIGTKLPDGTVSRNFEVLYPYVGIIVAAALVRTLCFYFQLCLTESAATRMEAKIRGQLYYKLNHFDVSFYRDFRTGDIMTRMTSDLDKVRHFVSYVLREIIRSIGLFCAVFVYIMTINVKMALALISVAPLLLLVSYLFSKKVRPLFVELREKLSKLNSVTQENIAGNRVIKAFANEEYEQKQFDSKNSDFKNQNIKATSFWYSFHPIIEVLSNSLTVITILFGGFLCIRGEMTLGQLYAVNSLNWALAEPMRLLGVLLNDLQRVLTSTVKVRELYDTESKIVSPPNGYKVDKKDFKGEVEFKNVSFTYGGEDILKNISFKICSGQTLAIMGMIGSGKTTIVNLITRMCDASDGEVLVDGVNVKEWDLHNLRENIGVATQEVFLFSDTVEGNIAYGAQYITKQQAEAYAKLACADFATKLAEGLDTVIGERGIGLSGGQRQRIALARAFAKHPGILILDDTTSALDNETEALLVRNLRKLSFKTTKIIVAQRISSAKEANMIMVLDNCSISEQGTHESLKKNGGIYEDIYNLQYGIEGGVESGKK